MKYFLVFNSLAAFGNLTTVYQLSLYGSKSCRGQGLGSREIKVDSGCQRDFAGVGASAVIEVDPGNKDFGTVIIFFEGDDCKPSNIFFEGDDCKPSNIMQDGAAFVFENGCWSGNYGSYEVWDLWKVEGMGAPALK
jgi:hypothetical protein